MHVEIAFILQNAFIQVQICFIGHIIVPPNKCRLFDIFIFFFNNAATTLKHRGRFLVQYISIICLFICSLFFLSIYSFHFLILRPRTQKVEQSAFSISKVYIEDTTPAVVYPARDFRQFLFAVLIESRQNVPFAVNPLLNNPWVLRP